MKHRIMPATLAVVATATMLLGACGPADNVAPAAAGKDASASPSATAPATGSATSSASKSTPTKVDPDVPGSAATMAEYLALPAATRTTFIVKPTVVGREKAKKLGMSDAEITKSVAEIDAFTRRAWLDAAKFPNAPVKNQYKYILGSQANKDYNKQAAKDAASLGYYLSAGNRWVRRDFRVMTYEIKIEDALVDNNTTMKGHPIVQFAVTNDVSFVWPDGFIEPKPSESLASTKARLAKYQDNQFTRYTRTHTVRYSFQLGAIAGRSQINMWNSSAWS